MYPTNSPCTYNRACATWLARILYASLCPNWATVWQCQRSIVHPRQKYQCYLLQIHQSLARSMLGSNGIILEVYSPEKIEMHVRLISARKLIRDFICHVASTATQIELDFSRLPLVRKYTQVPWAQWHVVRQMRSSFRLLAAVSRDPPQASKLRKPAVSFDHVRCLPE